MSALMIGRRAGVWSCLLLMLCALIELCLPLPVFAAPVLQKRVVVVTVDGLRLSDITPERTPNLWRMGQLGASGLINHNTLGAKNDVNAYLTLGAGSKAGANLQRVAAYGADELVREESRPVTGHDLYMRHYGTAPQGAIVVPQLPQVVIAGQKSRYTTHPGLLGDAVHRLGGKTAVLGNADLGEQTHRPAALIAMDSRGLVDYGDFQAGIKSDPTAPFGMRTDTEAMLHSYQQLRDRAQLIVISTGDLLRLQKVSDLMQPDASQAMYDRLLGEADRFVGGLMAQAGPGTLLAVLSPMKQPSSGAPPLSPVLMLQDEYSPGSLLSSGTTKRTGLLANYDLAPTFVQFLGGDPAESGFLGQSAFTQPQATGGLQELDNRQQALLVPSASRSYLVRPWINAWIGLAVALLLAKLFREGWLRYVQPLAEAMLIFPLSWLYVPLCKPASAGETILYSLTLTLSIWLLLRLFRDPLARVGTLAAATAATVIADLISGAHLLQQSVLSYDPVVGARYYGIGNEYMGVLLGTVLLSLNIAARKRPEIARNIRRAALVLFMLVTYLFAAPALGTNAGGALAAAVACTYAMIQLAGWQMRARHWLLLCGATTGVLLAMIGLNTFLPGSEQTHIGRAAAKLFDGQFAEVFQIAWRKMQLNFVLLRVSAWGKLLILCTVMLLVWGLRGEAARTGKMFLIAALAAFAFNDSGVVAAALMLPYAVVPLLGGGLEPWSQVIADAEEAQHSR